MEDTVLEARSSDGTAEPVGARPGLGSAAPPHLAPLLELDPELGAGLSGAQRRQAKRALRVRTGTLDPGGWDDHLSEPGLFGLLLVEGALVRRVAAGRGRSLEVLTKGDLARPWEENSAPPDSSFSALNESRVAILDRRTGEAIARWPALVDALLERALRRVRRLAVQAALDSRAGIERRVVLTLWQLAKRVGIRSSGGVVLPLPLTHQMIADLVGAQRSSVSAALSRLGTAGTLTRTEARGWLLDQSKRLRGV
jgi:CRP-like cAMP-binding protein